MNLKEFIKYLDEVVPDEILSQKFDGSFVKDNFDYEIDELREKINNSKNWLANYQTKLISETEINSLKIKFTDNFGYFIEIPKSQREKIPEYFRLKQTLVSAFRYETNELVEFMQILVSGQEKLISREKEILEELVGNILENSEKIRKLQKNISFLDFSSSLAISAYNFSYTKPEINEKNFIEIDSGRHPVIERISSDFVSNNLQMDKNNFLHVITGPNMGGKSTFLRQNALIAIMSQIGSFVPAKKASLPIFDRIFSRVGAYDNLFLGQSTFMVEMQEMANILNHSGNKSFVIIDEIGRGTSTYDGLSLAWAILKQIHDKNKSFTLFATHYHEIIDESSILKNVKNFSVAVGESKENIVFLRKIIPGGVKKSYGLEVAKLAGINSEILGEAKKMLGILQTNGKKNKIQLSLGIESEPEIQIIHEKSKIEESLKNIDENNLTPILALNLIHERKREVKN